MTQVVTFTLALAIAPLAALALLIWGLNGTSWLIDFFTDRNLP